MEFELLTDTVVAEIREETYTHWGNKEERDGVC